MGPHRIFEARIDRELARRWLLLAVGSLVLAGTLALTLVLGRTPGIDKLITDPLLFKRALVVHVDLSLIVWFYAFAAGLFSLLPSSAPRSPLARVAPVISFAGVLTLIAAAAVPGAKPLLSNYIPMIDHPVYAAGLLLFAFGVAGAFLDPRLLAGNEGVHGAAAIPEGARPGLRTAAIAFVAALITFFGTWLGTPRTLPSEAYYEVLFWGGGHILQFASEAAMVSCWIMLLSPVLGRSPLSRNEAALVFGVLLVPALAGPVLALQDPVGGDYRLSFMRLMQWGIFPAVSVALLLCVRSIVRAARAGTLPPHPLKDGRLWAFGASALLTVLGFTLGALIRGSNTMVPAHYHAAIGAVTASFMAVTYQLLGPLGLPITSARLRGLAKLQPVVFGFGQAVFAAGFALAGAHGMGRKHYGAEQLTRTLPETIGLGVMGLGGLVAVLGGLSFLWIVAASVRRSVGSTQPATLAEGSRAHGV